MKGTFKIWSDVSKTSSDLYKYLMAQAVNEQGTQVFFATHQHIAPADVRNGACMECERL